MSEDAITQLCSTRPGSSAGAGDGRRMGGRDDRGACVPPRRAGTRPLFGRVIKAALTFWLGVALFIGISAPPAQAANGDRIVNTATFSADGMAPISSSVTVTLLVSAQSSVEFLKYAPLANGVPITGAALVDLAQTYYRTGSNPDAPFAAMPLPTPLGAAAPLDLNTPVPLIVSNTYHAGEPIFVRVSDLEQNLDGAVRETALITLRNDATGTLQVLRLTETAPDSGIFAGFINSADATTTTGGGSSYSGLFPVTESTPISASYVNAFDPGNSSSADVIVDPFGIVFDSSSGNPVDGATVTLWDLDANDYAVVYGDDGALSNIFPAPSATLPRATVVTGSTPRDSAGRLYAFPPGGFRFPFVKPGRYQLRVTPPPGYKFPGSASDAAIAQLPGGPFTIVEGSRGLPFSVNPGPALRIDVPVDPVFGILWAQKSASKSQAAPGDFVQYQITVQNTQTEQSLPANAVLVTDRLPAGFRYRKGSARLNGIAAADPAISSDGRTLSFAAGNLPARGSAVLSYVVQLGAGAKTGIATNTASAVSGTLTSNLASAQLEVRSDFLSSRGIVMGRVYNGACSDSGQGGDLGLAGVRIYLEDGSFVETDKNGMYHFEGITPTTHVVQLDLDSLPPGYQVTRCEENSRFAGRAYSQFVELQGGTLWRSDFHVSRVRQKSAPGEHDEDEYLQQNAEAVAAANARLTSEISEAKRAAGGEAGSGAEGAASFGKVGIDLKSALQGETIDYQVRAWGGVEQLSNRQLQVTLPAGVAYLTGSSELDGQRCADPQQDGGTLRYALGDSGEEWIKILRFRAVLKRAGDEGDLETRAVLEFDTPSAANLSTPEADNLLHRVREEQVVPIPDIVLHPHFQSFSDQLDDRDKEALDELARVLMVLDISQIRVAGHTDNVPIAARSRRIHPDNVALSGARARSVVRYLAEKLHLPPAKVDYIGYGEKRPVASNGNAAGRAENRRVEIRVQAVRNLEKNSLELLKDQSGLQQVEIPADPAATEPVAEQLQPAAQLLAAQAVEREEEKAGQQGIADKPGILSPSDGNILIYPVNGVRICLDSGLTPRLTVDGRVIGSDRIGFTMKDAKTGKTIYSYIGVDFGARGERLARLEGLDPFGVTRFNQTIKVLRSGEIAAIRLKSSEGNIADGKTPVRLQLELLDSAGNLLPAAAELEIREGTLRPLKEEQAVPDQKADQAERVHVDMHGNALFQPVGKSGAYRVLLAVNGAKLEAETYVKPVLRDWILVGLAEGSVGYNTVSGHLESLPDGEPGEDLYESDRLAFYAKGTVRGEWLLTAAFDSAKSRGATGNGLFQQIDPNTYYTLYGDASRQQYDASSLKKLYLKIEREQFYAMFGDFDTGLTVTELTRYSRRLNGVKTEYHGRKLELSAFGSQTAQAYVKDEIQGDGTSGLYRLTRTGIAINSEKIVIEVRDRFRSEIILSARELSRHTEYSIDYDSGTLLFKEPIYSRDDKLNPVFIVAQYETRDAGTDALTYGGRVGVKLMDQQLKAGVSYLHEGQVSGKGETLGIDTTIRIGTGTTVKLEAARTESNYTPTGGSGGGSGNAYLAEITDRRPKLDSRLYYREISAGFGLGQQQASEVATRKIGIDAAYKLTDLVTLNAIANRQYLLATGADADRAEGKATYSSGNYGASLGVRYASDRLADGSTKNSDQLTAGVSLLTLDKKLTLRLDRDQSIGGNASADYPTRTTLGAEYRLSEKVGLFGQQEFTEGESTRSNTTRVGLKSTPWQGGAFNSSVERNLTDNQERTFALFGLKQTWQLNDRWSVDGGLDRNQTLNMSYRLNPNAPPASGGEEFSAVSLGTEYKEKLWSWNGRGEFRTSPSEEKWGVLSALLGEPKQGWGVSARLQLFHTDTAAQDTVNADLRLGLVYRPLQTRWIILDRLDLLYDRQSGGSWSSDNRRIVNNLSANFRPDRKLQFSLQYGAKYVLETLDSSEFSGYTDLVGVEGRYDITSKWDLGVRGSLLHTWGSGELAGSSGVSVGYNIVENAWLSLGYNLTGFSDKDFSASNYTARGPYMRFRFKFDQNSVQEALKWVNQ